MPGRLQGVVDGPVFGGGESVEWMASEGGVARFVEVGAGNQLSGMVKRNAPDAEALALNEPADLEAFAKTV